VQSLTLDHAIAQLKATLRPGQQEMAEWTGGSLAVSAVPGAGKSHGMAAAAAIALAQRDPTQSFQQLLLVTFTRSAAASLRHKVRQFLKELDTPQSGFQVHTLHGLALNIALRHPDQVGFDIHNATLISPYKSHNILRQSVEQWTHAAPLLYRTLLEIGNWDGEEGDRLRRQSALRSDILPHLAQITIHEAKSSGLTPVALYDLARQVPDEVPILAIAAGLYEQYDALLRRERLMDYDDMIVSALNVLENPEILTYWQQQILAVFEDEAQDSTPLQTQLLHQLATRSESVGAPNLVRVGDPNQAINSTFTPADPLFFRQFCHQNAQQHTLATMDQSPRSCLAILDAANFLVQWANRSGIAGEEKPFTPQAIAPVSIDTFHNTLHNPTPIGRGIELLLPKDVYQTIDQIGQRAIALHRNDPTLRMAVLVRENKQARCIAEVLTTPKRYGLAVDLAELPVYDVGASDRRSHVPEEMLTMLQFVAHPHLPDYFKAALTTLAKRQIIPTQDFNRLVAEPEQILYPTILTPVDATLQPLQTICRQLLEARFALPLSQLILYAAALLEYDAAELATADKLARRLHQQLDPQFTCQLALETLQDIVSSERFEGVELDDDNRYTRAGQLTLITMHKAKGLDWDVVFIPFLHESVLPGSLRVPIVAQFIGDFTLAEVARAQIRAVLHQETLPSAPEAWQSAKELKTAEEFRLLYVAMTRAKRLLWMSAAQKAPFSWGLFDWERQPQLDQQKPCPFIPALRRYLSENPCIAGAH
jgi:DNA helicase II / ATP-dependent DNA helicase PcrA